MDKSKVYIIGMDVGASKCRAKLSTFGLRTLEEIVTPGANLFFDRDRSIKHIRSALERLLRHSSVVGAQPQNVLVNLGVAGSTLTENREFLRSAIHQFGKISILPDYSVVSYGALDGKEGSVVALGTGAVSTTTASDGLFPNIVAGGHGFPVSDIGAGAWIGLEAIRQVVLSKQTNEEQSYLSEIVLPRFENNLRNVTRWSQIATAADYAAFAPLVFDAFTKGDGNAERIINSALNYTKMYVDNLVSENCGTVVLTGGIGEKFRTLFPNSFPENVTAPIWDGATGACRMVKDRYEALDFSDSHI